MRLTLQKRLAAQMLKCSQKKIKVDETRLEDIKEAITKRDIRGLISENAITKKDINYIMDRMGFSNIKGGF